MTDQDWVACVKWMSSHSGLGTRAELRSIGICTKTIRRRIDEGLLVPVNRWTFGLPGVPMDLKTRTLAAVLALPNAIPTGPSAAVLLGRGPWDQLEFGDEPWLIHSVSRGVSAKYIDRMGYRTSRALGVTVASPADSVIDLARFLPIEDAVQVTQRALQTNVLKFDQLMQAQATLARRAGGAQLRSIVSDLADGTRSDAERLLVQGLRDSGMRGWIVNFRVRANGRGYEIDVAFPDSRLAVEVDGKAFHSDVRAFNNDRRRQNDPSPQVGRFCASPGRIS